MSSWFAVIVSFVMTGKKDGNLDLPVKHFNLPYRDYLLLLKVCDVVLTMSRMVEGWNRTAHEAMVKIVKLAKAIEVPVSPPRVSAALISRRPNHP